MRGFSGCDSPLWVQAAACAVFGPPREVRAQHGLYVNCSVHAECAHHRIDIRALASDYRIDMVALHYVLPDA